MKKVMRIMRVILTLALAAAVVGVIWQRLGPRLEDLPDSAVKPKPLDPAFVRLTPRETATLPLATRFDMPLGSEHGAFTYNARAFRIERHLGDDLNGIGGENSDLGDPVYAAGAGRVVYAGIPHETWGKMILIAHRLPEGDELGPVVQTMYAHLESVRVRMGQIVQRGDPIGTVGTAKSAPLAHLHFEVRIGPYVNPGQGYADTALNRVSPEQFIRAHRGAGGEVLNPAPQKD
ncbi:M23 family metallopeptidase [Prosthecobacter sp.]|uniref:M23 family metallopeptidase n=1 Tax=Prosthecobacter sp. TaxID=1965333 RepID=UPI002ABCE13C|nr:M23 family metallopeptidase [Prosthecobacter sp.]MDZ4403311.1 M23 family metallopeptidase [Prosthecobacter sp.]